MRNKKIFVSLLSLMLLLLIPITAFAHPGRLDSNGGHYNRDTGKYHYHDGSHSSSDHSSDDTYDDDYVYDYSTGYTEHTTKKSNHNTTKNEGETDNKMLNAVLFFTILIFITIIIGIVILYKQQISYFESIDNKVSDLYKNNENTTQQIQDALNQNPYDYTFKMGIKIGTEEITHKLIEKAYQMGVRDSDTIKKKRKERQKLSEQGIRVNIDVPTAESITDYVKSDETIDVEQLELHEKTLEELFRAPIGIEIDRKTLTISDNKYPDGKYGRYTVYRTKTGNKIHLKKGCCGADIPSLSFVSNGKDWYYRCDKCFSEDKMPLLYIPEWYADFREYKKKNKFPTTFFENDFKQ